MEDVEEVMSDEMGGTVSKFSELATVEDSIPMPSLGGHDGKMNIVCYGIRSNLDRCYR